MKRLSICLLALFCALTLCACALAETYESALGYRITYDADLFDCESDGVIDTFRWRFPSLNAPACWMSVSVLTDYTMDEAMDGLALQAGHDGQRGQVMLDGVPAETFRFDEGNAWNSRVCEYALLTLADDTLLLIETDWYLEAEEGVGQKLLAMRQTMVLPAQDAQ